MKRLTLFLLAFVALFETMRAEDDRPSGIDLSGIDTAVRPQDDLFRHVNGRWLLATAIPADKSNYGSFTALADAARENVRTIIEESAQKPADEIGRKIGDFYQSYMNEELINKKGMEPLSAELAAVDALVTTDDVISYFGRAISLGISGPINFTIEIDDKNSSRYLANVSQHGLTLPDRDYYLGDKENYRDARQRLSPFTWHACMHWRNFRKGLRQRQTFLKIEITASLAQVQWSKTELRDAEKRYNLYRTADLGKLTEKFPWQRFFEACGVSNLREVNVTTPSYFQSLTGIVDEVGAERWKEYLRFRALDAAAPYLTKDFADAHFELHERAISGVPEQQPRWKSCLSTMTSGDGAGDFGVLGDALLGNPYVKKSIFPPSRAVE